MHSCSYTQLFIQQLKTQNNPTIHNIQHSTQH